MVLVRYSAYAKCEVSYVFSEIFGVAECEIMLRIAKFSAYAKSEMK